MFGRVLPCLGCWTLTPGPSPGGRGESWGVGVDVQLGACAIGWLDPHPLPLSLKGEGGYLVCEFFHVETSLACPQVMTGGAGGGGL